MDLQTKKILENAGELFQKIQLNELEAIFFNVDNITGEKEFVLKETEFVKSLDFKYLRLLMHYYGLYTFPTIELIELLKNLLRPDLNKVIEIGSGLGIIAKALKIPATDSKIQEQPDVKLFYKLSRQPTIEYPNWVEKLDYKQAIKKYKPDIVLGSWVTHKYSEKTKTGSVYGIDEEWVIHHCKQYVLLVNDHIHKDKSILNIPHVTIKKDYLISRIEDHSTNSILKWNYNKKIWR